jgi:RNA polymerase sigma-70 factor (ECF subfamily)
VALFARRLADTAEDAQDILQETFLTAWRKRADISVTGDSLLPWLMVTCRNHASNMARRNGVRATVALVENDLVHAADPLEHLQRLDDLKWIRENVATMNELDQRLIGLCFVEGRSYQEAADQLGIGVGRITKRIHRVRDKLRGQRLTQQGEEPA